MTDAFWERKDRDMSLGMAFKCAVQVLISKGSVIDEASFKADVRMFYKLHQELRKEMVLVEQNVVR